MFPFNDVIMNTQQFKSLKETKNKNIPFHNANSMADKIYVSRQR